MAEATIKSKPSGTPATVTAPARQSNPVRAMKSTWKVPDRLKNSKYSDRATALPYEWDLLYTVGDGKPKHFTATGTASVSDTSRQVNLDNFPHKVKRGSSMVNIDRNEFYPNKKRFLKKVTFRIRGANSKGRGRWASAERKFTAPKKPTISARTHHEDQNIVTFTVTADAGAGYAERYDTRVRVTMYNSSTGETTKPVDGTFTGTSKAYTVSVPDRYSIQAGQHISLKIEAWSRGYAGDSEVAGPAWHVIGYPNSPVIKDVSVPKPVNADTKVVVKIDTKKSSTRPVDRVLLEALVDTDAASAAEATSPADATWEPTGAVGSGDCTALVADAGDITPGAGKRTWIRVKAWHDIEGVYYSNSAPREMTELAWDAPTAADDACEILSSEPGADGESAVVVVAWDRGEDDSTGTELSWSDSENAWRSTEPPKKFEFGNDWNENGDEAEDRGGWSKWATVIIAGLSEETTHVKARRFLDPVDGDRTYGPYCPVATITPAEMPSTAVLLAPPAVPLGSSATFSWTFDSPSPQRSWQLLVGDHVLAEGEDAYGSKTVGWEQLADAVEISGSSTIAVRVAVSTGGGSVESNECEVRVVDPPSLALAVPQVLDEQPLQVALTTDDPQAVVVVKVTSQGNGGGPDGSPPQAAGDTVWSSLVAPEWEASGTPGTFSCSVTLPEDRPFHHGASYSVEAVARNDETGLSSETAASEFAVEWSHRAPVPPDTVSVTPATVVDEEGRIIRRATVSLAEADGMAATDTYEVYRVTGDGPVLIASGLGHAEEVVDDFAPFGSGEHGYRVVCRTADGDAESSEYPYELACSSLRFDFDGTYVECPYDVSLQDGYTKDFESLALLDGSVTGDWNEAVTRRASLSTRMIRFTDAGQIARVRRLARHAGPVFVRTPDGSAYEANVDVSGIGDVRKESAIDVAFDAVEIGLTSEFMPSPAETANAEQVAALEEEVG